MIFKAIRYLIYSPLILIIEDKKIYDVEVESPQLDIYNNYEVIGIRAESFIPDDYVVISLKPTLSNHYENYLENCTYKDRFTSEQSQTPIINAKD